MFLIIERNLSYLAGGTSPPPVWLIVMIFAVVVGLAGTVYLLIATVAVVRSARAYQGRRLWPVLAVTAVIWMWLLVLTTSLTISRVKPPPPPGKRMVAGLVVPTAAPPGYPLSHNDSSVPARFSLYRMPGPLVPK